MTVVSTWQQYKTKPTFFFCFFLHCLMIFVLYETEKKDKREIICTRTGSARALNGCHGCCWKKGTADVDDWSYDNDRLCFLEPCGFLLCCQWHLGIPLNACAHCHRSTTRAWRDGRRDNPVTHIPSKLPQQWRVRPACKDRLYYFHLGWSIGKCFV